MLLPTSIRKLAQFQPSALALTLAEHASLRQGWIDEAGSQEGLGGGRWAHGAEELLAGGGTEAGQHRRLAEVAEEDVLGDEACGTHQQLMGFSWFFDLRLHADQHLRPSLGLAFCLYIYIMYMYI